MTNNGYSELQNGREFYIAAIPIGTMIARTYNITNRTGVSLSYNTGGVYGGYLYIGGYSSNLKNYKINLEWIIANKVDRRRENNQISSSN